jgi:hypothetical protein
MNAGELLAFLEKLDLPHGEYAIFGGACLTIRNIRNLKDLDIFVSENLYEELLARGWQETSTGNRKPYLINRKSGIDIQAFSFWEGEGWQPKINSYIGDPEIVNGIPFMPLQELYKWKAATRRPKDLEDLKLINIYLTTITA